MKKIVVNITMNDGTETSLTRDNAGWAVAIDENQIAEGMESEKVEPLLREQEVTTPGKSWLYSGLVNEIEARYTNSQNSD